MIDIEPVARSCGLERQSRAKLRGRSRLCLMMLAAFVAVGGGTGSATRAAATPALVVPDVPEVIRAPAGEKLVLMAHATGAQIYVCSPAPDGKLQWNLKGPDAKLHDRRGAVIGTHFAGPAWKYQDGSEVIAKAAAHVDSPDGQSIPWLLLTAAEHRGAGLMATVSSIQRIHTSGGKPIGECTTERQGAQSKSRYSADYYFYAPAS